MAGGISDIYTLDLASGQVRQLTNDRNADEMPQFSPDGQTIAFTTDRGPSTSFKDLRFSPLQLATISVNGGPVTVYSPFPNAKEINPQYTPDGKELLFVSDQDGFSDVYRLDLATGEVRRVTKVATGVSGITETSPAITVSPTTGRMLFTVFQGQGYAIYGLDAAATTGVPVQPTSVLNVASILPPGDLPGTNTVTAYLERPVHRARVGRASSPCIRTTRRSRSMRSASRASAFRWADTSARAWPVASPRCGAIS